MRYVSLLVKGLVSLAAEPRVWYSYLSSRQMLQSLAGDPRLRDVVLVYSQVIWDDVWQRPQEYAMRTGHSHTVIYVAPVQVHDWLWRLKKRYKAVQVIENAGGLLIVVSPLVRSGHFKLRGIQNLNGGIIAKYLQRLLAHTKTMRILVNTPFAYPVLNAMLRDTKPVPAMERLVYDVIDDFTAFDWSPKFGKEYDRELLQMADAVLTGTHQLAKARHGSTFIPCGVNYEQFSTQVPRPEDISALPSPLIGYFGTISERIDLDLIAELADAFPNGSVVMIGPVHFQGSELPKRPNLHFRGLKRHEEIPGYAQAFDVGLIPFRITPATVQLHPVKTLEYLAAGVPVVSTALPEVKQFYGGIVDIAESNAQFIELVRRRIADRDEQKISAGRERARQASWEAMTSRMNDVVFARSADVRTSGVSEEPESSPLTSVPNA